MSDPNQPAVTNGTVVFHGSIINNTGTNIVLSSLNLSFSMAAAPGAYQYDLAPEFFNTGGVIPTNGYSGPLVVVTWSNAPTVGALATGDFTLTAETNLDLPPLTASFSSFYEAQVLSITPAGTNVILSWSASGSNMILETTGTLGDDYYDWGVVPQPVALSNGLNTVILPVPDQAGFFQLVQPQ